MDRKTERQKDQQTVRQMKEKGQIDRQIDIKIDRYRDSLIDRQKDVYIDKQVDDMDRKTERKIEGRKIDKQNNILTDILMYVNGETNHIDIKKDRYICTC